MGTDVHVLLRGGRPEQLLEAENEIRRLEDLWTRFKPASEVSRLNASQGALTVVSPETFSLVKTAVDAWILTGGLFDPTIEAAMMAAGYRKDYSELTRSTAIHPVFGVEAAPTPEGILLDSAISAVRLPEGVTIDLGGIGKGAAADRVATQLLAEGADGCVVNLGGDMRVEGKPPTSEGWPIVLDCPGSQEKLTVHMAEGAVCTSTKAKRTWASTVGEQHHLRDPTTGESATSDLMSVSVICARATQGEVLAKTACLVGSDEARKMLSEREVTGVLVGLDGSLEKLDGFDLFEMQ